MNDTVITNHSRSRGLGSRLFDGEGLAVQRRVMVDDGVLTGWFLDLASAAKLEMTPTGNARRGLGSAPSPGASNFYIENSTISRDALIAEIDEGFLITEMIGSSVDMITGDYTPRPGEHINRTAHLFIHHKACYNVGYHPTSVFVR